MSDSWRLWASGTAVQNFVYYSDAWYTLWVAMYVVPYGISNFDIVMAFTLESWYSVKLCVN